MTTTAQQAPPAPATTRNSANPWRSLLRWVLLIDLIFAIIWLAEAILARRQIFTQAREAGDSVFTGENIGLLIWTLGLPALFLLGVLICSVRSNRFGRLTLLSACWGQLGVTCYLFVQHNWWLIGAWSALKSPLDVLVPRMSEVYGHTLVLMLTVLVLMRAPVRELFQKRRAPSETIQ